MQIIAILPDHLFFLWRLLYYLRILCHFWRRHHESILGRFLDLGFLRIVILGCFGYCCVLNLNLRDRLGFLLLLFAVLSFFSIKVVLVLMLGNVSVLGCWGRWYVFRWRMMQFLFFLIIKNIHKLLENLLVFHVHTGIHMLVVFFKFLFCFGRSLLCHRLIFILVRWRRDCVIFIFINILILIFVCLLCEFCSIRSRSISGWFLFFLAVFNVRLEQVGNISNVLWFKLLFIESWIIGKRGVKEVLSAIIMVHTDVFELEVDFDEVVGQIWWELDDLVSKILDELIIDVGNPGLKSDWYVLKQKVNSLLLLKDWLELDKLLGFEFFEYVGLFEKFISLLDTDFEYFSDKDSGHFTGAFFTLSKRVVIVHDDDDLSGHFSFRFFVFINNYRADGNWNMNAWKKYELIIFIILWINYMMWWDLLCFML